MSRSLHGGLRVIVCIVVTIVLWRIGGGSANLREAGGSLLILPLSIFVAIVWFVLVGIPFAGWFGEKFGGMLWTSGDGSEVHPEYSIPEARVKQGRYQEAIEGFREYIVKYPLEIAPHLRIADIHLFHLNDPQTAMVELQTAIPKAQTPEAFAMANFRLSELYLQHAGDTHSALECLKQIQHRHPGTKQAGAALERAKKLIQASSPKKTLDAGL